MRCRAMFAVLLVLAVTGCGEVKKELDKPGPAPPYDPKAAELDPNLVREKPADGTAPAPETPDDDEPSK